MGHGSKLVAASRERRAASGSGTALQQHSQAVLGYREPPFSGVCNGRTCGYRLHEGGSCSTVKQRREWWRRVGREKYHRAELVLNEQRCGAQDTIAKAETLDCSSLEVCFPNMLVPRGGCRALEK